MNVYSASCFIDIHFAPFKTRSYYVTCLCFSCVYVCHGEHVLFVYGNLGRRIKLCNMVTEKQLQVLWCLKALNHWTISPSLPPTPEPCHHVPAIHPISRPASEIHVFRSCVLQRKLNMCRMWRNVTVSFKVRCEGPASKLLWQQWLGLGKLLLYLLSVVPAAGGVSVCLEKPGCPEARPVVL